MISVVSGMGYLFRIPGDMCHVCLTMIFFFYNKHVHNKSAKEIVAIVRH